MKCTACGSENLHLIKVFSGATSLGWSPVGGEKDMFGHYKKLRPLLAHACADCGAVSWNVRLDKPLDADETAAALDELSVEAEEFDPAEASAAYSFEGLEEELA